MIRPRVIPCLLLVDGGVVKTRKFKNPQYVGDPLNALKIFNQKEVDELIILDISATKNNAPPNFNLIEDLAGECFMPLAYGGGIRSVEDAHRIFSAGIEKIILQSAANCNMSLIADIVKIFGSQSIAYSIDIKKNIFGQYGLYDYKKQTIIKKDWLQCMQEAVAEGAGELIVNAVDRDGTKLGSDINLVAQLKDKFNVPLIYMGGINSLDDISNCMQSGADGVGVGSLFIYQGHHNAVLISYPTSNEIEALHDFRT